MCFADADTGSNIDSNSGAHSKTEPNSDSDGDTCRFANAFADSRIDTRPYAGTDTSSDSRAHAYSNARSRCSTNKNHICGPE
jgi:hypothetical protein